eukprot:PhM_4_TR15677/c0_g1_i1/m.32342/K12384/SCARB2, LIMP2, CD36L2; lysosome membrane protein 2
MACSPNVIRGTLLAVSILFLVAGAVIYVMIPKMIKDAIFDAVKWKPDTVDDGWYNASVDVDTYTKYYLFNCTNVDEVERGAVPQLRTVGPYTYQRHLLKKRDSVVWNENDGTVRFSKKYEYVFRPELSTGTLDDIVYTYNLPFAIMSLQAASMCASGDASLWHMLPVLKQMTLSKVFVRLSAQEALWGHNSTLFSALGMPPFFTTNVPLDETVPSEYLTGTGPLSAPGYEVKESTSWLTSFQGMRKFPFWLTDEANTVGGFTGSNPPFDALNEKDIPYFVDSLFRMVYLEYQKDVDLHGLTLKRYVVSDRAFLADAAFGQTVDGFLTLPPALGLPMVISRNNFYECDTRLLNLELDGHNPPVSNEEMDNVHLDIQGHVGYPFRAHNRMQMNMPFGPIMCNGSSLSFATNYTTTMLPFLKIAEEYSATSDDTDDFQKRLFLPMRLGVGFAVAGMVLGVVGVIGVVVSVIMKNAAVPSSSSKLISVSSLTTATTTMPVAGEPAVTEDNDVSSNSVNLFSPAGSEHVLLPPHHHQECEERELCGVVFPQTQQGRGENLFSEFDGNCENEMYEDNAAADEVDANEQGT